MSQSGVYKPAPVAVLDLIQCVCKTSCKGHCACKKNTLSCTALCKCHNSDCNNLPDYRMIADEDDLWLMPEDEQGWHYQKIVYHWFNSLSVRHGMFHDRCVVYVCLKNINLKKKYCRPNLIVFNVLSVYLLNRLPDMQCSSLLVITSISLFVFRFWPWTSTSVYIYMCLLGVCLIVF